MNSSWTRTALKYTLLLTPTLFLAGLVTLVAMGAWVSAVLRDPARFPDAPGLVQTLARAAYWHTRTHWHTVPDCILFDEELLYRPRPGACVFENAEFRTTMHFDAGGARLTPPPRAMPDGALLPRLVVVGDSHAMGWGVEDGETFASVLASGYGYRTVNLAVSSYGTPRELLRLHRDFALAPDDVVVIQYSNNDLEEGRRFRERSSLGRFGREELQRMIDYRPAEASALPVAGVLLRIAWQHALDRFGFGKAGGGADAPDPSTTFLGVLAAHPELAGQRLLVVAISKPGVGTHLSAAKLAAAGHELIVPELGKQDFLHIDDHMRAQGHRTVAAAIDQALRSR